MRVGKIVPCVCIDHYPNGLEDGMPDIAVGQGEWFSCYCRNCGRGGRWLDHESAFKALRDWNRVQKKLWQERCYEDWYAVFKRDIADWEERILEEYGLEREPF